MPRASRSRSRSSARTAPRRRRAPNWRARLAKNWQQFWANLSWPQIGKWLVLAIIWGGVLLGSALLYFTYDMPAIDEVAGQTRRPSLTILAADGTLISRSGDVVGERIVVSNLPSHVPQAVLAAEDRRFYQHGGIDLWGLLRALYHNLRAGRVVQGGSTLTQQLAKNLFLTPDRTLRRKVQEAIMALWLEGRFTKDEIFSAYLNRVYLGAGTFGFDAAAQTYFNKSIKQVNFAEAALLAGLLKAPSRFAPTNDPDAAKARARLVLQNMVRAGFLLPNQLPLAEQQLAALNFRNEGMDGRYFAAMVSSAAAGLVGSLGEDVVVTTTLESNLQRAAEQTLEKTLASAGEKSQISQGAIVLLGNDGAIRAYVGGRDFDASEFDRARQAQRQPGSAFKPFVYLAALQNGITPSTLFDDTPQRYGRYAPANYDGQYYGSVTATTALAKSLNTVAVQLANMVGVNDIIRLARALGISSPLHADLSLALGTSEVNLLELTTAYAGLSAGGRALAPYGIERISGRDGRVLYQYQPPVPRQIASSNAVADLVQMLTSVISSGTGQRAAIGRAAAGKTGTTQDYRDAWFVGFTGHYTAGVWVGNDDNTPMKRVTGGNVPASIWAGLLQTAEAKLAPAPLAALNGGFTPSWQDNDSNRAPDAPPQNLQAPPDELGRFIDNLFR